MVRHDPQAPRFVFGQMGGQMGGQIGGQIGPAKWLNPGADLASAWCRIGAGFNVAPASSTPDLEELLVETVRAGRDNARLIVIAATWLSRFGGLVARHRLRRMAIERLDAVGRAVLGLLLDTVREHTRSAHFNEVIAVCRPLPSAEPLFHVHDRHPALRDRLERRATALSRRWNLLAEPIELKPDALYAPSWVMRLNPSFALRADYEGDLRCSIVEEILRDPGAGDSELELARRCGATRTAVRHALDRLALAGRVERERVGRRSAVRVAV